MKSMKNSIVLDFFFLLALSKKRAATEILVKSFFLPPGLPVYF